MGRLSGGLLLAMIVVFAGCGADTTEQSASKPEAEALPPEVVEEIQPAADSEPVLPTIASVYGEAISALELNVETL